MNAIYEAPGLHLSGRLAATDLSLVAGELVMLIGPNGAGKTSLLRAASGIDDHAGAISIGGHEVRAMSPAVRAAAMSYLGTSRDVTWPLLARDYVALGLPGRAEPDRVQQALDDASASEFADRRIDRLSTGERSRVMLARTFFAQPQVLLLDEPCSNLDPYWQVTVIDRLREYARSGKAVLISVHDLDLALSHADRLIVMNGGEIVHDGTRNDPAMDGLIAETFSVQRSAKGWEQI